MGSRIGCAPVVEVTLHRKQCEESNLRALPRAGGLAAPLLQGDTGIDYLCACGAKDSLLWALPKGSGDGHFMSLPFLWGEPDITAS